TTLPVHDGYFLWKKERTLTTDLKFKCQKQIYQWTSNNPNETENAGRWGYSMPTDMANCAQFLGLEVEILVYSTWTVKALKLGYEDEWNRIRNHHAYRPRRAIRSHNDLAPDERELKVLSVWENFLGPFKLPGSMHVVMVRPDGSVMEPSVGEDKRTF